MGYLDIPQNKKNFRPLKKGLFKRKEGWEYPSDSVKKIVREITGQLGPKKLGRAPTVLKSNKIYFHDGPTFEVIVNTEYNGEWTQINNVEVKGTPDDPNLIKNQVPVELLRTVNNAGDKAGVKNFKNPRITRLIHYKGDLYVVISCL